MFIREKKNKSGSISIQLVSKATGRYKVVKSFGSATIRQDIEQLKTLARQEMKEMLAQPSLFKSERDDAVERTIELLNNSSIRTLGPELIYGKIYDHIGFNKIPEDLFRHLVISRLAFPLSKLKTSEYLNRYQGVQIDIDSIYRFLDKLASNLKSQVEFIAYEHTLRVLDGKISVVFYDMTTLYFEASDEDDLRKTGFSKDGKHQHPQIFIGLLVGLDGYAIGYDIYEGNTYEGHTLIPFLEKISRKFNLNKPIVVADSALLSKKNIEALEDNEYQYILGARIKNETQQIKAHILSQVYQDGGALVINKEDDRRLVIQYSSKRAAKDAYNRKRGLKRLEKRIRTGKLTKANINNRGYNKYLKLEGQLQVSIDMEKFEQDAKWDGLKGYLTNTTIDNNKLFENYNNLWHIERAFRISKTDLRIRPIFHRLRHRIEAHICIAFCAYMIYKELDRVLLQEKSSLSVKKAADVTQNMYQITYELPDSKLVKSTLLKMDEQQQELFNLINKYF